MVKQKKKRNKAYTGVGASVARPTITRVSAIKRNKPQQWWLENKRLAKPLGIATLVAIAIIWLIFELLRASGLFGR